MSHLNTLEHHEIVHIPRKALVVGATGYVGNALVQDLVSHGIETVAHIRPQSRLFEKGRVHFEAVGAGLDHSPWERDIWRETLISLRPTVIFSCLGTTKRRHRNSPESERERETYRAVDYGLTKMLIDSAIEAEIKPKFIYLSSVGASEKSLSSYLRVRGELETYLQASGLEYVIARPGIITGKDRAENRPLELFAARLNDRLLSILGKIGFTSLPLAYRSFSAIELADALIAAAFNSDFSNTALSSSDLRILSKMPPL